MWQYDYLITFKHLKKLPLHLVITYIIIHDPMNKKSCLQLFDKGISSPFHTHKTI